MAMTRKQVSELLAVLADEAKLGAGVHFHAVNLEVHGKVFAFAAREGVGMKLPPERVQELVDAGQAEFLQMGTKTMKGWLRMVREDAAGYRRELPLVLEAHAYVAAEAEAERAKAEKKKTPAKKAAAKKSAGRGGR